MKKRRTTTNEIKIERPPRAQLSTEEVLKRMKEFSKRKERFIAAVRTGRADDYLYYDTKNDGTIQ